MAFQGKNPVRSKIVINNKPIKPVSHFKYLDYDMSFDYDNDIDEKKHKFQAICSRINRTLGNKTRKDTKIKFCKTMATPVLMYGSESWKAKYSGSRSGISKKSRELYKKRFDKRHKLNVYVINENIVEYRQKWKPHVTRPRPREQ